MEFSLVIVYIIEVEWSIDTVIGNKVNISSPLDVFQDIWNSRRRKEDSITLYDILPCATVRIFVSIGPPYALFIAFVSISWMFCKEDTVIFVARLECRVELFC